MHSVSEMCARHGCGSDWVLRRWDWDGSQVQTHSGPGPGPQEERRWGQSTAGAAVGGRAIIARPGKSLSLSETPGLGHDRGMRVSLKRWRGPRVITQLLVSGEGHRLGNRAGPHRHGSVPHVTGHPWVSLIAFLGSVFALGGWMHNTLPQIL